MTDPVPNAAISEDKEKPSGLRPLTAVSDEFLVGPAPAGKMRKGPSKKIKGAVNIGAVELRIDEMNLEMLMDKFVNLSFFIQILLVR